MYITRCEKITPTGHVETQHCRAIYSLFVNLLEHILEQSIVGLQNGVFRAHIHWPLLHQTILETRVRVTANRLQTQ